MDAVGIVLAATLAPAVLGDFVTEFIPDGDFNQGRCSVENCENYFSGAGPTIMVRTGFMGAERESALESPAASKDVNELLRKSWSAERPESASYTAGHYDKVIMFCAHKC